MAPNAVALPENATLAAVVDKMCSERLHRLLVLDEQQRVVGIITTMDVLCYLRHILNAVA